MADVLLVADGIFHPPWGARRHVTRLLSGIPGIELTQIRRLNYLENLDSSRYQAMVLYYHHKRVGLNALAAFDRFVNNGGGVLAIHSATASFKDKRQYFEILGGQFSGHGPVELLDIQPTSVDDEIFGSVGSFTVTDELYLHDLQPGIEIHFTTQHEGELQPMVWTRMVGNGRVCYVCPGHRTATMKQPEMEEILRRALAWVLPGDKS